MSSNALMWWRTAGRVALDEIARAHAAVGGDARGRRYATGQLNNAYAVMLSSQFQSYCRRLHSEAAKFVAVQTSAVIQQMIFVRLTEARKLDLGNPNPGNIGSDFNRFGTPFWPRILARYPLDSARLKNLEELNAWRNAIAHQDFSRPEFAGKTALRLHEVRRWRNACNTLATHFDAALSMHFHSLFGSAPW